MKNKFKTVIVIYSHIVGLAVIRALGKMNIPIVVLHYLPSEMGYCSRYVQARFKITNPEVDEKKFICDINDLTKKYKGSLLVPTDDYTVAAVSKNKKLLKPYYLVSVEDWNLVEKLIKKHFTYEIANSMGISCPDTYLPKSLDGVIEISEKMSYPCLIKPCEGHIFFDYFRLKMFKVNNKKELIEKFKQLEKLNLKIMIQEIIPGNVNQNVNYNSYFVDGSPIAEFTARKVRVDPPFFGSPRVLVSQLIPEVMKLGRMLLKKLNYNGFSCMEFKYDYRDKKYKLMEINCRHNLSGSLAVKCGINFPYIMYKHLMYDDININLKSDFQVGVYWIDLTKDIMRLIVNRKKEGYSLKEYVKPYFNRKTFAILSVKDPLPFLKRCIFITFKISNNVLKRIIKSFNKF